MGTDILSIKSSIWALSCSSTSGEMNKWVSSRSWKQMFFWWLTGNRTCHLDDKFWAKSELLIKMQKKLKCKKGIKISVDWEEHLLHGRVAFHQNSLCHIHHHRSFWKGNILFIKSTVLLYCVRPSRLFGIGRHRNINVHDFFNVLKLMWSLW